MPIVLSRTVIGLSLEQGMRASAVITGRALHIRKLTVFGLPCGTGDWCPRGTFYEIHQAACGGVSVARVSRPDRKVWSVVVQRIAS